MSKKSLRKIPGRPEKRHAKKVANPLEEPAEKIPTADWLPDESAGFMAWGLAAERATIEFSTAWQNYHLHNRSNAKQIWEDARDLLSYTLQRVYPEGLREGRAALHAGTSDNLEMYIVFLEADFHFFSSGYAKADIIKGLKRHPLTHSQKRRLQSVVLGVIDKGFRREFRDYCRLARSIQSPDWLQEVETRLSSSDSKTAVRARWVLEACRKK